MLRSFEQLSASEQLPLYPPPGKKAMVNKIGRLLWNERAQRYRTADGRFVRQEAIDREIERVIALEKKERKSLALSLHRREISIPEFQLKMRDSIKAINTLAGALGRGGRDQMTQADWGKVGSLTRAQYRYLDRFCRQLESGEQRIDSKLDADLPDKKFLRRAQMYMDSARGTYRNVRTSGHERGGYNWAKRVLGAAEHCAGCVHQSERGLKGWVPIKQVAPIGSQECGGGCKCRIIYARELPKAIRDELDRARPVGPF